MYGPWRPRVRAAMLLGASLCGAMTAARAGDTLGPAPDITRPQIMLYVSHPLGSSGRGQSTFGLRYERAYSSSSDPSARFYAPLRHHSLIDLQLTRGYAPRVLFGPRVTWDLGRSQLGPTAMLNDYRWPLTKPSSAGRPLAGWAP